VPAGLNLIAALIALGNTDLLSAEWAKGDGAALRQGFGAGRAPDRNCRCMLGGVVSARGRPFGFLLLHCLENRLCSLGRRCGLWWWIASRCRRCLRSHLRRCIGVGRLRYGLDGLGLQQDTGSSELVEETGVGVD
jgi:hypothetical protein